MCGSCEGSDRALGRRVARAGALAAVILATSCGGAPAEQRGSMPATVCMTPDNRCPAASPRAAEASRSPLARALAERPADTEAICDQAHRDFAARAERVDRRCRNDADCVVLDVGYCGTLASRRTSAPDLFEQWRDLARAGCVGDVECASYGAQCVRGQCESPPPLRG